ncbi:CD80 protein, partial [Alcedo cyanopectus]|nr:CD80 protein [Ceyx cyanopectus]
ASKNKVVKTKMGEKVGLPCCHEIPSSESLRHYRVYWQKNTTEVVLAYAEGNKISRNELYDNRTELDTSNLTLWISPVELLDNGSYQCIVQHLGIQQNSFVMCDNLVHLFVTADFSMPKITANISASSCESTEVVVRCSSHGGVPRPKISGAINNKTMVWNDSSVSRYSHNLYTVTATLWHRVTREVNFTCSVEYNGLVKSTSLLLKKTNDCVVPTVPPPYNVITASSIIIIIFILAVALAARYLSRHVCSHCCKPQDSVEEGVKEYTKTPVSSKVTSETSSV